MIAAVLVTLIFCGIGAGPRTGKRRLASMTRDTIIALTRYNPISYFRKLSSGFSRFRPIISKMTLSPFSIAACPGAHTASNELATRLRSASGRCIHLGIQEQA
jgi:hypothetical protein